MKVIRTIGSFRQVSRLTLAGFILMTIAAIIPSSVGAAPVTGFKAGRIIDDVVFTNANSMNAGQIQAFLNSKVPTCETWHSPGYGQNPPFTCLKDFSENGRSAAQIIYDTAQQYQINPQVLIVLLQKEQGLVTDTWPLNSQYRTATGYGCPDTAPCDSQYYGLTNQLNWSGKMFRAIMNNSSSWYTPYVLGNNYIRWSPDSSCGGSNVYIENRSTQALYNYTPYQPNQAALNAGYGTGDSCSAYGNRNFYLYFNDWFNSYDTIFKGVQLSAISQSDATPARGQTLTYSFKFTNTLSSAVTLNGVGAVGRIGSLTGANGDLGWVGPITLQPGASQQFTFTSVVRDTGQIYIWPAILYDGTYIQYNNWGSTIVSHVPNFTLSQPLTASSTTVYAGQDVTFSATLKNNEPNPINYDAIGIPVKFYDRYSYDAVWVGPGVVAAGADIPLSGVRNIDKPGPYSYWVSNYFGDTYSTIGSVQQLNSQEVSPNFSVSGLSFTNTSPVSGGNLGASFTVKNNLPVSIDVEGVGVVGRYDTFTGPNRDLGWQGPFHFNAGETKTFTGYSNKITEVGKHHYWIGVLKNGNYIQYNNWGSTIVSQAPNFSVSGLSFTNTSPAQGENLGASFTVKNNLSVPLDVDAVGVVGRYGTFTGPNRDIGWQGPFHFNAGETKTFTGYTRTITEVGTHYYWIGVLNNGSFIQYNNWGSTIVSRSP